MSLKDTIEKFCSQPTGDREQASNNETHMNITSSLRSHCSHLNSQPLYREGLDLIVDGTKSNDTFLSDDSKIAATSDATDAKIIDQNQQPIENINNDFDNFVKNSQTVGIELLPQDEKWLRTLCSDIQPEQLAVLLKQYIQIWFSTMQNEPLNHKKQNIGRFAANTFIRESLEQIKKENQMSKEIKNNRDKQNNQFSLLDPSNNFLNTIISKNAISCNNVKNSNLDIKKIKQESREAMFQLGVENATQAMLASQMLAIHSYSKTLLPWHKWL